ncbi:MAG: hypothetical protein KatS3mg078_0184 [Deltaproteobacteria bacterium]|jgi:subtilisin family serine protease|nr:MAG: hypothetical protein KatS3mg078_0184 [Deltaproteobacteria bacterium]
MKKVLGIFSLVLLTFLFLNSRTTGNEVSWGYKLKDKKYEGTIEYKDSKISHDVQKVLTKLKTMGVTKSNLKEFKIEELSTPLVKIDKDGNIQVYIYLSEIKDTHLEQLKALEVRVESVNREYSIVQGWAPFYNLEEISNLGFVRKITPPSYGKTKSGSVVTEGDVVIGSNDVREILGFDGSGITVGVISDGVDEIAVSQSTGELPDNIIIGIEGKGNEGTALLEIIHDIAPGAQLAFSSGLTDIDFIDSIRFLTSIGADVIVDDLGFLQEPFFEDGRVSKEVQNSISKGVVFVSAGGNDADQHYQAVYVDGGAINENIKHVHDFGKAAGQDSNPAMRILIPPLQSTICVLQWNDQFGKSSNDYDLFLFDSSTGELIDYGIEIQNGDDNPIELAVASNTSSDNFRGVDIVINLFKGVPKTLEMFFSSSVVPVNFNVPEDSVYGHPAVPNVIAVGAVSVKNPDTIEEFSSQGPSTIFFPFFESRPKPDLVAPDGVSTSLTDFNPFFGTSASAPHVAGVVALILDKNPTLQPSRVKEILGETALDLGQPGFDNVFGFGRVDAFEAVKSVDQQSSRNEDTRESNGGGCSLAKPSPYNGKEAVANAAIFVLAITVLRKALKGKRA